MSVSVHLVRLVVDAAARAGADRDDLWQLAGCRADQVLGSERVDLDTYNSIQASALELSGDPALGLHMGEQASPAALNVLGYLFLNCHTIGEAIQVFIRYHRLISDCSDSLLRIDGDRAMVIYRFPEGPPACNRLRAEFGLTQLIRVGRQLLGRDINPLQVGFSHARPDYDSEYRRLFGCPIQYQQAETSISLPAQLLHATQAHPDPQLFSLLQQQADRLLLQLGDDSLGTRIRRMIREQYGGIRPDIRTVASRFHMSERSLRRKLAEAGLRYSRLADEAVCAMACERLDNPDIPIQGIAADLGFSEPSAFHRAFKRWTGLTPQQYRLGKRAMAHGSTLLAGSVNQ